MRLRVSGKIQLAPGGFTPFVEREVEILWMDIIRQFLEDMLEQVPSLSGATKRSFADVVSEFGASVDFSGPTHAYQVWEGWEHKHGQWATVVTKSVASGITGKAHFALYNMPQTFAMNDYRGTIYRQYWRKFSPPWINRESSTQEPWDAILPAKATMLARLRSEMPLAWKTAVIKAIWTGRRRR